MASLMMKITLLSIKDGMMFNKVTAQQMREMVSQGTFGFGVFECHDLLASFGELKAKGVGFAKAPTKEFYGFEALFKDESGNWWSPGQKQ